MSTQIEEVSSAQFKANKEVYYQNGKKTEQQMMPVIFEYFGIDTDKYTVKTSRYNVIDWTLTHKTTGEVISIELKGRTNSSTDYPSTIYGANKIIKQIQGLYNGTINEAYAIFAFTDGLYYYRIKPDCIKELTFKDVVCTLRGKMEKSLYAHIPINLLTKMES